MNSLTRNYKDRHAVLVVRTFEGRVLCATDHFVLTMFSETDQERTAAFLTAGDPSLYVGAGIQPRLYSYGGIVGNSTVSGKGVPAWMYAYERYLRGTKCQRNRAVVELSFKDQFRMGYMVSCKLDHDAGRPQQASLMFSLFIIDKGVATLRGK